MTFLGAHASKHGESLALSPELVAPIFRKYALERLEECSGAETPLGHFCPRPLLLSLTLHTICTLLLLFILLKKCNKIPLNISILHICSHIMQIKHFSISKASTFSYLIGSAFVQDIVSCVYLKTRQSKQCKTLRGPLDTSWYIMQWWCADNGLMMQRWCVDDAAMMHWWCTDDALMWWCAWTSWFSKI